MVAFIGNLLRGKVSGENFDESIASNQIYQTFPLIKALHYTMNRENFCGSSNISKIHETFALSHLCLLYSHIQRSEKLSKW